MIPFKKISLPLVILTLLSLSPLSHTAMAEDSFPVLLETWKGRLLKTGEILIENEGSPSACISTVRKMEEDLEIDWAKAISYRDAAFKKIGRPVPTGPLFDFDQWSEEFKADPSSGIKLGVMEALDPLENLIRDIEKLKVIEKVTEKEGAGSDSDGP